MGARTIWRTEPAIGGILEFRADGIGQAGSRSVRSFPPEHVSGSDGSQAGSQVQLRHASWSEMAARNLRSAEHDLRRTPGSHNRLRSCKARPFARTLRPPRAAALVRNSLACIGEWIGHGS